MRARRFVSRIQHACALSAAKLQADRDDSRHDVLADAGASRWENIAETKRFAARVLARADRLIAVSNNTRCDAAQILRVPQERIEVIHHGVADEFFYVSPDETRAAASKYGLSRPYILFVGTLEPRKNVDTLIDAFLQLPPSIRNDVDLVLAGAMGWRSQQLAERLRASIPCVRWLGYVAENDLAGLTAGAIIFAYPSLYEGFGLPVAQAMAAGVPVVTSNVSSLPEIAGDAAILVDPKSSLEISASLERLLLDPSLRQRLAANGVRKASPYRWDACAAFRLRRLTP